MNENKEIEELIHIIYNQLDEYRIINDKILYLYQLNQEYNSSDNDIFMPKYLFKLVNKSKDELKKEIKLEYKNYSNLVNDFSIKYKINKKLLLNNLSLINLVIKTYSYNEFNDEIEVSSEKIKRLKTALKIDNILNEF